MSQLQSNPHSYNACGLSHHFQNSPRTCFLPRLQAGPVAVLNFFVMGLTVQKAVTVDDDSDRRKLIRASQLVRLLVMGVVVIVCAVFPKFDIFALFIPLFFPRLFAQARGIYGAVKDGKNGGRTE